jgi:serine/threonine protein kinase
MRALISRLLSLRYEVLERVGEGAFFQVYKARDKSSGRIVAVKILQPAFARDPALCNALRQLKPDEAGHPNMARLLEVQEDQGTPFLVTEFVRGINLKERIRRIAPFTLSVAVDFAIAIGEALHYAHGEGNVHGDLRSHNVIISPEGAVKVTDFGLVPVMLVSPDAAVAHLARAVHYQAPEISEGAPPTISADLYALGIILFEMLTGGLPYPGETPQITLRRHCEDPIPSPRALNPGVPRSLDGIVIKSLQKNPQNRYRSAADMLSDLKSVRDALRFGKPLSWSPLEVESPVIPSTSSASSNNTIVATARGTPPASPRPTSMPDMDGAARMSATRTVDEHISPFLKLALGTVLVIILIAIITGTAVWMAVFSKPPEHKLPNLVGLKWEEAKRIADNINVRLMPHEEYNEKVDPGVIYRMEGWEAGRPIRPGRSINVWVSKGSRMVWVPDVRNLAAEEAETKLKQGGLLLGEVNRQEDNKVPYGFVISQNPRAGKRVKRDTAVNLVVSDGPKITEHPAEVPPSEAIPSPEEPGLRTPPDGSSLVGPEEADMQPRLYNLTVRVKRDNRGTRRVRIEYDDARGPHLAVDEIHNEGDEISQKVEVYGRQIVVRVYYGDDFTPISEKTIVLPSRRP